MPPAPKAEPNRAPTRRADSQQDAVVNASPEARLIVESGPGCGKTDVACARVARLIDSGVPAARIVLLSFTRTAVREIRARIRQIAAATSDVAEVDVRTLDSFAGSLRTGASLGKGIARATTYDDSIKQTIVLLREGNLQLKEYLSKLRHVIVDEAQDLVGDRAELVRLLLELLPSGCGWTVFLDPAQSIFDWSETGTRHAGGRSTFLEHIKEIGQKTGVGRRSLEKIRCRCYRRPR
jgi:DNA helicase II / ATP-dependent DNA helicase PcrA